MRAPTRPPSFSRAPLLWSTALALATSTALATTLSAQESPPEFSLPDPTPSATPTGAPQGPVDVRSGVPIGPRRIQPPVATPTEAAPPTPSPTETAPSPNAATSPPEVETESAVPVERTAPDPAIRTQGQTRTPPTVVSSPSPQAQTDQTTSREPAGEAQPSFDDNSLSPSEGIDPAGPTAAGASSKDQSTIGTGGWFGSPQMFGALAVLMALLAGIGWWFWRRNHSDVGSPELLAAPKLAAGVREPSAPIEPAPTPMAPIPPAAGIAPKMALELNIASASRSMMMFTVEYRLNIANRADQALRDLSINASLVCAKRSASMPAPIDGKPAQKIERIGPNQSRTVSGTLQMPLSEISPLRQGTKPLFIPLIEMCVKTADQDARVHKFVLGLPSAASSTRLHPIPLDTPPGGVRGLRANEIKDAAVKQTA